MRQSRDAAGPGRLHQFETRVLLYLGKAIFKRYTFYTVEFEYDPAKSRANKEKHGLDFEKAKALWDDPDLIEIPVRMTDEPRFLVIGRIGGKHWSAVITYREDRIRLISVRRSREEEIEIYES